MTAVPTVRGQVDPSTLGPTLMHEHLFISNRELEAEYADLIGWDEEEQISRAGGMLERAHAAGIGTLVALSVLGHGRSIARVARVAEATSVNIVVATGLYTLRDLPRTFEFVGPGGWVDRADPLVDMFIDDLTVGIGGTGIRAAVIKVATDTAGMTAGVERVLRAAAAAHRETGAPISTHTAGTAGLDQQRIFREEGVDLTAVVIGHSGDSTDLDHLKRLADAGSTLGMDRFGYDGGRYPTAEQRVSVVARLAADGYADRMVLSHDTAAWRGWLPPGFTAGTNADYRWLEYDHIPRRVVPALFEYGVSPAQLNQMLVLNPSTILGRARDVGLDDGNRDRVRPRPT